MRSFHPWSECVTASRCDSLCGVMMCSLNSTVIKNYLCFDVGVGMHLNCIAAIVNNYVQM